VTVGTRWHDLSSTLEEVDADCLQLELLKISAFVFTVGAKQPATSREHNSSTDVDGQRVGQPNAIQALMAHGRRAYVRET
jgi:hypothetical protein